MELTVKAGCRQFQYDKLAELFLIICYEYYRKT